MSSELPYTWNEFANLFKGYGKDPDAGSLNAKVPFSLTNGGQRVSDVTDVRSFQPGKSFVDLSDSEHSLMKNVETDYTQTRGDLLTTINQVGSQASPVFRMDNAPLMDPLEALNRASSDLVRSMYFDDYKHLAVENFVTQFHDVFKAPIEALRGDPLKYILGKDTLKDGYSDLKKMSAAKVNIQNLKYILGLDNDRQMDLKVLKQNLFDTLFSKGIAEDPWKWSEHTDPIQITRGVVFHKSLGLFSMPQMVLQAAGVTHTFAIDGNLLRAARANIMATMFRTRGLSVVNPKAQGMISKAIGKALGLSPDLVDEAYDALLKSGMNRFEGEYGKLADQMNPKLLKSKAHKVLDFSTVFFKEGNLYHRNTSFLTSFLRWRTENPTTKLTASSMTQIKNRAELMSFDMSRAMNNSIRSKGLVSIPLQYTGFFENLVEQLMGKRLSVKEKAQMLVYQSAIWGIPSTAGMVSGGGR